MVAGKLELVPRYRQKVRSVPLAIGSPAWIDDPHFSLDYHLRHTAVPAPGSEQQLREMASRVFSQPSTATSRCGSCGSSSGSKVAAGRCCRRSTTAWSTASPLPI